MSKQSAVDFLVKQLSEILGKIHTEPFQDLLLVDAINKSKQMGKEQLIEMGYLQIQNIEAGIGDFNCLKIPEEIYYQSFVVKP